MITVQDCTCISGCKPVGFGDFAFLNRHVCHVQVILLLAHLAARFLQPERLLIVNTLAHTFLANSGHIAGGLAGIYLGWSMGPKLKARLPRDSDSSQSQNTALVSLDTPAPSKQDDAAPKQMDTVDVIGGVQRVSASVALLTALVGFTASVIIQRAGHLSLPRGLGLHL